MNKRHAVWLVKRHYQKLIFFLVISFFISILFGVPFKAIFFISFLLLLGSISTFYYNYFTAPINFELIKFGTILTAAAYGFPAGLFVGIFATFASKILISRIDEKIIFSLIMIAVVAFGASFASLETIVFFGILLSLIYNVVLFSLGMFLRGDFGWLVPYHATDFIINTLIFMKFAEGMFSIIAL